MKTNVLRALAFSVLLGAILYMAFIRRDHRTRNAQEYGEQIAASNTGARASAMMASNSATGKQADTNRPSSDESLRQKMVNMKISMPVAIIVGIDPQGTHYNARVKAMRQLTRRLSADDCQALQLFLAGKFSGKGVLKPLEFEGLKNDVLGVLLRQEHVPDGLSRLVIDMYHDTASAEVWRTYCLQFMVPCYDAVASAATPDTHAAAERQEILDAYQGALDKKNSPLAGTSLICMETLSHAHPEFNRDKIAGTAVAMATDETCGESTRITALSICAIMGRTEILPVAQIVAQTGDTVPLRMAATAAVGDLGGKSDQELLRSLSADNDKRMAACSISALRRLNQRLAAQLQ